MSVLSAFSENLAARRQMITAWIGSADPANAALLAREAFDVVTFDMQHGVVDLSTIARGAPLVMGLGKPVLARIPVGEFQTVSRLFDIGCSGVIAPMVNSVEDAKTFASFAKFPPMGARSWGPHGAMAATGLDQGAYLKAANGLHSAIAMIETREALAIIDDILAVKGIDGVLVGPSDLAIALSRGDHVDAEHADVNAALAHVVARARAAGKFCCCYSHSGERAAVLFKMGFDIVALMSDAAMLKAGAQAALKAARG
ncbi:MAG: HpcH/HpaI aldolase family protein [Bosea sp. (in: a-proteobacteria)]